MHVSLSRRVQFAEVLQVVRRAVGLKNSAVIFQCVRLQAVTLPESKVPETLRGACNGLLRVQALNGIISITASVYAKVEEPGVLVIPFRHLAAYVGLLWDEPVVLRDAEEDREGLTLHVSCGMSVANFLGINPDDFPTIPRMPVGRPLFSLSPAEARLVLQGVGFCVADTDAKPILQAIHIQVDGEKGIFVATDGWRLSRLELARDVPDQERVTCSVLPDGLEILVAQDPKTPLEIGLSEQGSLAFFRTGMVEVCAGVPTGAFPNWERVLEAERQQSESIVDREDLLAVARRLATFAGSVQLEFKEGEVEFIPRMIVETVTHDISGHDVVEGEFHGEPVKVGCDVTYLKEAVQAAKGKQIVVGVTTENRPLHISVVGDDRLLQVIMPMVAYRAGHQAAPRVKREVVPGPNDIEDGYKEEDAARAH